MSPAAGSLQAALDLVDQVTAGVRRQIEARQARAATLFGPDTGDWQGAAATSFRRTLAALGEQEHEMLVAAGALAGGIRDALVRMRRGS